MEHKKTVILVALLTIVSLTIGAAYKQGEEITEDIMYMVSHSEYWSGEEGQIIARLYDWQGDPITVDNCTVDIYYPDSKDKFIDGALTNDTLQTETGTHFYKFTVPSTPEGVYQYMVTCSYPPNKQRSVASSFHLNPALNYLTELGDNISTLIDLENTHYDTTQQNLSSVLVNQDTIITNQDTMILNLSEVLGNQVTLIGNQDSILLNLTDVIGNQDTMLLNLTSIHQDTDYIRENMLTEATFSTNLTDVLNNQDTIIHDGDMILSNLTVVQSYCDNIQTEGSSLCQWMNETLNRVSDLNNTLGTDLTNYMIEINQTTHSTYDYLVGTVTSNLNTLLSGQTTITNTVNRIETTTTDINNTVNSIETDVNDIVNNQEDVVYMEVTS